MHFGLFTFHFQLLGNAKTLDILIGTQGFSYKDWVGAFYPPRTSPKDYLSFYSKLFDTVELDTTFYAAPRESAVENWRAHTPRTFQFSCKLPQVITHQKHLLDAQLELDDFVRRVDTLDDRLGPLLIQMPPQFHYPEIDKLKLFLELLPDKFQFAIEFRHRSWIRADVYDLLRAHNVAWVMLDLSYMPKTFQVTADFVYIRWIGQRKAFEKYDRLQADRSDDLEQWARVIQHLPASVQTVYGYFNDDYAGFAPGSALMLKQKLGLRTVEPQSLWPDQDAGQGRLL